MVRILILFRTRIPVRRSCNNLEGRAENSIFLSERGDFLIIDRCISTCVEDLHERGLDKDCTVLAVCESGRTPRVSPQVGRDHGPK
jgi:Protein of unknown function (DUF1501)